MSRRERQELATIAEVRAAEVRQGSLPDDPTEAWRLVERLVDALHAADRETMPEDGRFNDDLAMYIHTQVDRLPHHHQDTRPSLDTMLDVRAKVLEALDRRERRRVQRSTERWWVRAGEQWVQVDRIVEPLPVVSHKGPHDTDASMFVAMAERLRGGYGPGGSNSRDALVRLIMREVNRADGVPVPRGVSGGQ